jgi:hypothetical protein
LSFNQTLTGAWHECLDIQTEFRDREYALSGSKADRLLGLLRTVGADEYVTGPSARRTSIRRMRVEVQVSGRTTAVIQSILRHGPFASRVSIVDTLMCCGDQSARYIWGYRNE